MKRLLSVVFLVVIAGSAFAEQTHRYVVGMKPERAASREGKGIEYAGRDVQDLHFIDAYVADLTDSEVALLRKDPTVRYVESADIKYYATGMAAKSSNAVVELHPANAQVIPLGINTVDATGVWSVERGDGIKHVSAAMLRVLSQL